MSRPRLLALLVALAVAVAAAAGPAEGAKKKRKKRSHRPARTATPTPGPYYGPPVPPKPELLRAAGATLRYEPGRYLMVAEVGETGRVFRLDEETELLVTPSTGTRVRVLYVEDADGAVAWKILPGPVEVTPTPLPKT